MFDCQLPEGGTCTHAWPAQHALLNALGCDCPCRFYGLLSSAVRVAGRNETSARNPVLNALDESVVTNNPMRAKKKPAVSLPSVANGNK